MAFTDYELKDLIARTNMSEVWSAVNRRTDQLIALKRRPTGARAERRFAREVASQRAAAGPHTMPILEWDESFDWYTMPWAHGTLAERAVPDELLVMPIVEAITASLGPIHETGQVHRDLKPENVLWLQDADHARWVVADFGIVRNPVGETTSTLTVAGRPLGTSGWMAPEQDGDAHESTPRTDVYAVGAIMSWLLTGRRPRPGRVELPDHGSALRHVIWKATRDRQSDRYFDLEDLKAAVLAARDPQHRTLADLVAGHEYSQVGVFAVANPSAYGDLIEELPRFSKQDVVDWYARDPSSLTATVHAVLQELIDQGVGDLAFSNVDRFMSWALHTVEADLPRDRDRAEMLAVVLFKAIADIHQFAPAKDVLNWLDRCSISDQRVMEGALRMAGAWEFFSAQASGRFVTSRTSPLVRRLAGELAG